MKCGDRPGKKGKQGKDKWEKSENGKITLYDCGAIGSKMRQGRTDAADLHAVRWPGARGRI